MNKMVYRITVQRENITLYQEDVSHMRWVDRFHDNMKDGTIKYDGSHHDGGYIAHIFTTEDGNTETLEVFG